MSQLVNEQAKLLSQVEVGPRLHIMTLKAPTIASQILPGQFVHMRIPSLESHVLRRPFSVYAADASQGTLEILYQRVGSVTSAMPHIKDDAVELIGPIGNTWNTNCTHALLVGGGVGAAPLFMLAQTLVSQGVCIDVILGAQSKEAHVCTERYAQLLPTDPICSTDDGTFGYHGFCTPLVEQQ